MPVYDTCLSDNDLPALELLPKYLGEVHSGSFVVMGYAVSNYVSKGESYMSCSVLWVMMCGQCGVPVQG